MIIRKITEYIAETISGDLLLSAGDHVRLIFNDATYQTGDLEEITEVNITISRGDGDYTYNIAHDIRSVELLIASSNTNDDQN